MNKISFIALILALWFGAITGSYAEGLKGDFDLDGDVDGDDLKAFSENFGRDGNSFSDDDNCPCYNGLRGSVSTMKFQEII